MSELNDTLENSSAEALLSLREKMSSIGSRRPESKRIRKPNPRVFGYDDSDVLNSAIKITRSKLSRHDTPTKIAMPKRLQSVSDGLRNLLKLPKAQHWLICEFFYSNIDRALFEGENDFCICLRDSFHLLRTRNLTRTEWSIVRKLMGKPRRCSTAFFSEERRALESKRNKIRLIQVRKNVDNIDIRDLPEEIPLPLVIGTKVTVRLKREGYDGLYNGKIDAVDSNNSAYRVSFDNQLIGSLSVSDRDVASDDSYDTVGLSSLSTRKRLTKQTLFRNINPHDAELLLNANLQTDDSLTLGGIPIKFLNYITRLTKLLGQKKILLKTVKDLNTEAEKIKSRDENYTPSFQQNYAHQILNLEKLNKKLDETLDGVNQSYQQLNVVSGLGAIDQSEMIKRKCENEAEVIVKKLNNVQGKKKVMSEQSLSLIAKLMTLLLQIRTFADNDMHAYEFHALEESLSEIKMNLEPSNQEFFQCHIEFFINQIQEGLSSHNPLHAFNTPHLS